MRVSPAQWGDRVEAKVNIPKVLARELGRKMGTIGLGTVTDPYQPVENQLRLTRRCLEEIAKVPHRLSILTKSDLVLRDIDILKKIPETEVGLSINTASDERARIFETCAPPPSRRFKTAASLCSHGISTYIFFGPLIPTISDADVDGLIRLIIETGVRSVMMDRLNLRPGMKELMMQRMGIISPTTMDDFAARVSNDAYYDELGHRLKDRLREAGVTVIDAF
jgi:DNA repair photolyase